MLKYYANLSIASNKCLFFNQLRTITKCSIKTYKGIILNSSVFTYGNDLDSRFKYNYERF